MLDEILNSRDNMEMVKKNWKYCSLVLSGNEYHYILDLDSNQVYTQLFPGIPVERFYLRCGRLMKPEILAELIKYKIGLAELENNTYNKADYDECF